MQEEIHPVMKTLLLTLDSFIEGVPTLDGLKIILIPDDCAGKDYLYSYNLVVDKEIKSYGFFLNADVMTSSMFDTLCELIRDHISFKLDIEARNFSLKNVKEVYKRMDERCKKVIIPAIPKILKKKPSVTRNIQDRIINNIGDLLTDYPEINY